MTKRIFYLNGKFLPQDKAKISVLDLGFIRGYGVFDFLRTYGGCPFKLDDHLARLKNSAYQIGLKIPWTKKELKKLVLKTLAKNNLRQANIKIIVSGGISPDQITPSDKPTLAILVYPATIYPRSNFENGIKVITFPTSRAFAQAKTINYIPAIIALGQAKKQGAVEALYMNEDREVLEGTTTNFFVFKKDVLITPKTGILLGITRQVVLELAKKAFEIERRPIKYEKISTINEAFITASNKEIMPVVKIDNLKIGNGKVGRNTKKIMTLFRKYTR